jgi:phosphoribosylanthranilate isomerase
LTKVDPPAADRSIYPVQHRTRVKICGVRRVEDALAAARLGADAVGMVLHPAAKRNVPLDVARQIIASLPAFVTPVGLFVDAPFAHVRQTAVELGLRHVQLNGEESPDLVAELAPLRVVKAIRVDAMSFDDTLYVWRTAVARLKLTNLVGLVLEPAGTGHAGGSGIANDWSTVRAAVAAGKWVGLPPLIAAGGLRPETVGDVIRAIHPYAVDVSSGVEDGVAGEKSHEKIAAFITVVAAAQFLP